MYIYQVQRTTKRRWQAKMAKSDFRDVTGLVPIKKIEKDYVVYENGSFAMVVQVNSIHLTS